MLLLIRSRDSIPKVLSFVVIIPCSQEKEVATQ